jgi:hypothetical protein
LDIERTAGAAGVVVHEANLGSVLVAASFGDSVVLNKDHPSGTVRRAFAFAHELAHVLIRTGRMPWVDQSHEELWADWFACELVVPKRWLRGKIRPQQIQLLLEHVSDRRTLALQMATVAAQTSVWAQNIWRDGDDVICARCGDAWFFHRCSCLAYRRDRKLVEALPQLIPSPSVRGQLVLFGSS